MSETRVRQIKQALEKAFDPTMIDVIDESHLHAGHAGARSGRGHFAVTIRAVCFEGLSRVAKHRLIFQAVGEMMQTDIHALRIDASGP